MKEKLLELNEIAERYNESVLSKVDENHFKKFIDWTNDSVSHIPEKDFLELYEVANGFEFNGLIIYSLNESNDNNIYDLNEEWEDDEDLKNYIFFGDSDITWYCYDKVNKVFCELDKPSATLMESHECFSDLISAALESIL